MADETYESWTKEELHDELANRGLAVSGSKEEQITRLEEDDVDAPDVEGVTTVDGRAAPNVAGMKEYEASFSENNSVAMAGETAAVTAAKPGNEASQPPPPGSDDEAEVDEDA